MTKDKAKKELRRLLNDDKLTLKHNPRAMFEGQRQAARERKRALIARIGEIDEETKQLEGHWKKLVAAARFVVDVDGDKPSIPQLDKALMDSERYLSLIAERFDCTRERNSIDTHSYPWEAVTPGGFCYVVQLQGDTLEGLVEQAKAKQKK